MLFIFHWYFMDTLLIFHYALIYYFCATNLGAPALLTISACPSYLQTRRAHVTHNLGKPALLTISARRGSPSMRLRWVRPLSFLRPWLWALFSVLFGVFGGASGVFLAVLWGAFWITLYGFHNVFKAYMFVSFLGKVCCCICSYLWWHSYRHSGFAKQTPPFPWRPQLWLDLRLPMLDSKIQFILA